MNLGISTSYNYNAPLEENIKAIAATGFKFISIGGSLRHSRYNKPEGRERIRATVEKWALQINSVHAPFDPTCDLTQIEDLFARNAVIEIKRAIDSAAELGAPNLIVHLNSFRPSKVSERIKQIKKTLPEVVDYAETKNVVIALENLDQDSEVLFKYAMDSIESQYLGVCYDNGHEMLYDDSMNLLKKYGNRMSVIHLHDNDGARDLHLVPFEGKLNLPALAGQLNKFPKIPPLTLECEMPNSKYTSPNEFLRIAFDKGMRFFEMLKHTTS